MDKEVALPIAFPEKIQYGFLITYEKTANAPVEHGKEGGPKTMDVSIHGKGACSFCLEKYLR